MKLKLIACAILLVCVPFFGNAQEKVKIKDDNGKTKTKTKPGWASAHKYNNDRVVYFPDYYTFYVPDRGYVYWKNSDWTASPTIPDYMSTADMDKARLQVIEDETTPHPEAKYNKYKDMYPPRKADPNEHIPIPTLR
jgi:hypothetical protein